MSALFCAVVDTAISRGRGTDTIRSSMRSFSGELRCRNETLLLKSLSLRLHHEIPCLPCSEPPESVSRHTAGCDSAVLRCLPTWSPSQVATWDGKAPAQKLTTCEMDPPDLTSEQPMQRLNKILETNRPAASFSIVSSGFLFPKHTISASCPNTDGTPAVQGPVLIRPSAQGKPERSRHNGKVRLIIHSNDPLAPLWRNRACTSRPWEKRATDESGWFLAMQAILWLCKALWNCHSMGCAIEIMLPRLAYVVESI